jgi:hypothetical protein
MLRPTHGRRIAALLVLLAACGLAACGGDERPALAVAAESPREAPAPSEAPRARVVDPAAEALGEASRYTWHEAIEPPHACSDGPDATDQVSIPGGDLGALVVAAATLEPARGLSFSPDELEALVESFAARFGHVTLHGDPSLLSPDLSPTSVACEHLRLLLGHPEEYGVRDGLVRALLDALARREAARPGTLRWSIDADDAREAVALDVERLPGRAHVPTYGAREGDRMRVWLFVPESTALHAHVLAWLEDLGPSGELLAPARDVERRASSLDALVTRQTRATLRHLAREMPVYEARFAQGDAASAPSVSGPIASMGCRTY